MNVRGGEDRVCLERVRLVGRPGEVEMAYGPRTKGGGCWVVLGNRGMIDRGARSRQSKGPTKQHPAKIPPKAEGKGGPLDEWGKIQDLQD